MALVFQRNVGLLAVGLWLVLYALAILGLGLPYPIMAVLALVAGLLILLGR